MKNYAKLGLAALAIIVIVLILWLTGVFGGAEHNENLLTPGNCRYPLPSSITIPEQYHIGGLGAARSNRTTRNVYGFTPAWGRDPLSFSLPQTDYDILGGHPSLFDAYYNYIDAAAALHTTYNSNSGNYTFNYTSFWTAASSTPFLTPSQYANNQQRRGASLTPLDPVLVPTGCGVNAWTGSGGDSSNSPRPGAPQPVQPGIISGGPNQAGCVTVSDSTETACASLTARDPVTAVQVQTNPYRVVINTTMPTSRTRDALGLSDIGLGTSNITGITDESGVDLLVASSDEITANDLLTSTSSSPVYLCCDTIQNARAADSAANGRFMSNKATVLSGREAEIARLTALVSRLGQLTTQAAGQLGAAESSAQRLLDTKYIHGFTSAGSIRA